MHGINNSGKIQAFFSTILVWVLGVLKKRISAPFDDLTLYVCMDSPVVLKITKLSPTCPQILSAYRLTF
jgi:hypothetical protein